MPVSSMPSLSSVFFHYNGVCIFFYPIYVLDAPLILHNLGAEARAEITQLLIMQFSSASS
jgi:hypothetical protein